MFNLDSKIIREYIDDPSIGYVQVERILDAAHAIKYQVGRTVGVKELSDKEIKEKALKDYESEREKRTFLDYNK